MLSRLPIIEPISKGIANALFSVAVASLGMYFFFSAVPLASAELLRSIAMVGAALLIAYAIEAVWLSQRAAQDDEYEEWLGFVTGAGIAGFLGVVFALLLAEHRAIGHSNFIDELGVAWVTVSLLILGFTLILQPVLAHRFGEAVGQPADQRRPADGSHLPG